MSLYDDASLIMYPSGYKANKIYSLKPTDGSGDLDFTRASTATRVNESGLIESVATGVPRIDYTGGGCGKLLLEPQRTNLVTYSEDFTNAYWIKNTGAILSDNAISPEGILNASKLVGVALTTQQWIYRLSLPVVSGSQYTFSIFAKKGEYDFIQLRELNNINSNAVFNLNTGIIHSSSTGTSQIQDFGNGWYKCSVTATATTTGNSEIYVNLSTDGTSQQSFLGDGTSGVYIWGAQLEQGSYPTSYIPTAGATATRLEDASATTGLSSLIGQTEGTILIDIQYIDLENTHFSLSDGSNNNRVQISKNDFSSFLNFFIIVGGVTQAEVTTSQQISIGTRYKILLTYAANDFRFYVNGVKVGEDLSGSTFVNELTNLTFGDPDNSPKFLGEFNSLILKQTATADAQAIQLTTL